MYTISNKLALLKTTIKAMKMMPKISEDIKLIKPILRDPNFTNLIVEI